MVQSLRSVLTVLAWWSASYCVGQVPLINFPDLTSITFHEQTGIIYQHTYNLNDAAITTRLGGQLNAGNRDFEGWPANEFYDVFYSNADGTFNINGGYVSIECRFDMNSGGGGLNINEVEFHFASGNSIYGSFVASYLSHGSNYAPGSEKLATDCNLVTVSGMGNTESTTIRLRLTIGMLTATSVIIEEACSNSGYEVIVGNSTFNEAHPVGTEVLIANNGCDSLVYVNLTFNENYFQEINYTGCSGDGYSIVVGNTIYNETHPSGIEMLLSQDNCDSIIAVNLIFLPVEYFEIQYQGCEGDGFLVIVNGTVYDESNTDGTETLVSSNGCDSIVTVHLVFGTEFVINEMHNGCSGDGYSIIINGNLYDEQHPMGIENIPGIAGCDTVVNIDLTFAPTYFSTITYAGCSGDGYSVLINSIVFDESHPRDTVYMISGSGCDSIIAVDLGFSPVYDTVAAYQGCAGDDYEIMVNGTTYDEQHPTGVETMTTVNGCDSVITVALSFAIVFIADVAYTGCLGDGYSQTINGSVYDESNPSGVEMMQTVDGCDSIIQVALVFEDCHQQNLDCAIYIPNVMSPNADGFNDEFNFSYSESCKIERFRVTLFDRWGEELYYSEDPLFTWKGDFKGQPLQPGVFVYIVEFYFTGTNQPEIRRGDLTLIR